MGNDFIRQFTQTEDFPQRIICEFSATFAGENPHPFRRFACGNPAFLFTAIHRRPLGHTGRPLFGETMEFSTLLCEKKSGYAVITLNRPDKLNALNAQT